MKIGPAHVATGEAPRGRIGARIHRGEASYRVARIIRIAAGLSALALLIAACVPPAQTATPGAGSSVAPRLEHDFALVAYQEESTFGGRESRFSEVFAHGKPVVLNYFAGLCPPCVAEMPAFQQVADELAGQFILVGLDVGPFVGLGSNEDGQRLLAELGIRYPAARAVDESALRAYQLVNMPTTILFRPDGSVAQRHAGLMLDSQFRAAVESLIKGEL